VNFVGAEGSKSIVLVELVESGFHDLFYMAVFRKGMSRFGNVVVFLDTSQLPFL
jgi:hypothetical protein